MATMQDRETFGRARLSFAQEADIDEFVSLLARFESGDIGPDEWRAFRLLRGTYGQRQTGDAQMMRVKIPQGILVPRAARRARRRRRALLARLRAHHDAPERAAALHQAARCRAGDARARAAGMTTREACGNSVRNITACPYSGVAKDEAFDVTPYAEALTRYLLRHPLSSVLPRKFKIAFEGCSEDHIGSAINDIGWNARIENVDGRAVRGFKVTVAGGTATMTRAGNLLHEFLPAEEMFDCAEAIIRVFHRLGDYKHKQKNRLKFLVKSLGWEGFRTEYERERAELALRDVALPFDPDRPPVEEAPTWPERRALSLEEIAARATATAVIGPGIVPKVEPQLTVRSAGLHQVVAHQRAAAEAGWLLDRHRHDRAGRPDVGADAAARRALAGLWRRRDPRDDGPEPAVPLGAHARMSRPSTRVSRRQGWRVAGAGTLSDVTSCPGAESCKLAVTQSRGLGRVLADHLMERQDLVAAFPGMDIKISGCPNGCGQHHIAGIGFQGSLKKVGAQPAPQYFVMVGGGVGDGVTTFGRLAAKIPARRCVHALERLVKLYQDQRADGESPLGVLPARRSRPRSRRCSPTSSACFPKRPSRRTSSIWRK